MTTGKSPKTIATINFKGGVGKTMTTWCLGDVIPSFSDSKVLIFDLDAQMSLTQAIALNEDRDLASRAKFQNWYNSATEGGKTVFHALDKFTDRTGSFDFPVGLDFVYPLSNGLHFVPSVEDLYWMGLKEFNPDTTKDFIGRLLAKISNSKELPEYDYVLFDCPPSFTVLSYSVLACCDLILTPINPDFFAAKGTDHILKNLRGQIEAFPLPQIAVFMNKVVTRKTPTKESGAYMREVKRVCDDAARAHQIRVRFLNSWIPERVGVKRAIIGGEVPGDLVPPFKELWTEITEILQ